MPYGVILITIMEIFSLCAVRIYETLLIPRRLTVQLQQAILTT